MQLPVIETEMRGLRTVVLFRDVDRGETPRRGTLNHAVHGLGPEIGPPAS